MKKWYSTTLVVAVLCSTDFDVASGRSGTPGYGYESPGGFFSSEAQPGDRPSFTVPFLSQEAVEGLGVPLLKSWIAQSRQEALKTGTNPIPEAVRANLSGFFSDRLLHRVRFRVGESNELSLQSNAFLYGNASAITLGDVIVFRNQKDAQSDYSLWAHELAHVLQYERWGIDGFARRYIQDYTAVERDAEDTAARFDLWYETVMGRHREHGR